MSCLTEIDRRTEHPLEPGGPALTATLCSGRYCDAAVAMQVFRFVGMSDFCGLQNELVFRFKV
jgi:hypothetical protein